MIGILTSEVGKKLHFRKVFVLHVKQRVICQSVRSFVFKSVVLIVRRRYATDAFLEMLPFWLIYIRRQLGQDLLVRRLQAVCQRIPRCLYLYWRQESPMKASSRLQFLGFIYCYRSPITTGSMKLCPNNTVVKDSMNR